MEPLHAVNDVNVFKLLEAHHTVKLNIIFHPTTETWYNSNEISPLKVLIIKEGLQKPIYDGPLNMRDMPAIQCMRAHSLADSHTGLTKLLIKWNYQIRTKFRIKLLLASDHQQQFLFYQVYV